MEFLIAAGLFINLAVLIVSLILLKRATGFSAVEIIGKLTGVEANVAREFKDMAVRLEKTRSDLNLEMTRELAGGLDRLRTAVDQQLIQGRSEQSSVLAQSRDELRISMEAVRVELERRLHQITGDVQEKLDKNIRESFAHFEKVQHHLQQAELQLRNVGELGSSIHDLNNLLRLPHLRGKFGEESLERLLADFLPANMYQMQKGPVGSAQRADAMIYFPERVLPIDAKFPREQVLALFDPDSHSEESLAEARKSFERVMKEQAKRVRGYIQPENGTTDMALMYLPSETLYMEAVRNRELWEELNRLKVLPASPNTLLVTLQAISMVHKWYQVQKGLAKSIEEFGKAQKSFAHFESKFEVIGKSLERAQDAFAVASGHLDRYKNRVTKLSGEEVPELIEGEPEDPEQLTLSAKTTTAP